MPTVLLGKVTIAVTAVKLDKSVDPSTAVAIYNAMAASRDPRLEQMTEVYQLAWTEIPANSEAARNLMLQQFLGFMTNLPHDGSRVKELGTARVEAPPSGPEKRESRIVGLNGKRFLLPGKEEGDAADSNG
jgi:hypothetical protein